MKTALEHLNDKIFNYNQEVNDMSKFRFNAREEKVFTDLLQEYAEQYAAEKVEETIDFANWINKGLWLPIAKGIWYKGFATAAYQSKSTQELYNEYLKSKP